MCLILDANKYGDFLNPNNADMQPVRKWIDKHGKIAYSPTSKFEDELSKMMRAQFAQYREVGKMKFVKRKEVVDRQRNLPSIKSNDSHILALAIEAKVRILVSSDQALHKDFRKIIKGGSIYQNRSHERLLTRHKCP